MVELPSRVAEHLGIFDGVLASDGLTNLTGHHKLASLQARFKDGFDYVGNASADVPLLAGAVEPMVANPDLALKAASEITGISVAP